MMDTMIDQGSYTPLYKQVAEQLRAKILAGVYGAGDRLPSEKELMDQHAISRITAVAALDELVQAGLAFRKRGRGTFAAQPFIENFTIFGSFTDDLVRRGLKPSSKLLRLETAPLEQGIADKLKAPPDAAYYCLSRLRFADDEPVAIQTTYLPAAVFPNISKYDFSIESLYGVMRHEYGLAPTWADAIIEAIHATPEERAHLRLSADAPALLIWHVTFDDQFKPLEYVRSVYRADRFSFTTGRRSVM
jgi:GntR family transcriptional regulator